MTDKDNVVDMDESPYQPGEHADEAPPVQHAFVYFSDKDAIWKYFDGVAVVDIVGRLAGLAPPNFAVIRESGGTINLIPLGNIVRVRSTSMVLPT